MALINCPECKKEVSSTAESCPGCGYALKPRSESNQVKGRRSGVFQIISFTTVVIALFTPRLFLNFFVLLVIGSAIISLVRREKRWVLSLVSLVLGFFLMLSPAISESQETDYKEKVTIVDYDWDRNSNDNFSYVRGRLRNDGDETLRYFEVKVYYLDDYGNVLDTDFDNDLGDLMPRMSKEFEIMHKNNPEYKRVKVEIDEVRIK